MTNHGLSADATGLGSQEEERYWRAARVADEAFVAAMMEAIRKGNENPPVTIVRLEAKTEELT